MPALNVVTTPRAATLPFGRSLCLQQELPPDIGVLFLPPRLHGSSAGLLQTIKCAYGCLNIATRVIFPSKNSAYGTVCIVDMTRGQLHREGRVMGCG